jgi:hypothetical protein
MSKDNPIIPKNTSTLGQQIPKTSLPEWYIPETSSFSNVIDSKKESSISEFSDYLPEGVGKQSGLNLEKIRAQNQSGGEQARRASAQFLLNVIPEAIKQTANVLDFEDYINQDDEIGNSVATAMQEIQEEVKSKYPIYKENPGATMDFGDPGYVFSQLADLTTSIGGFVLTGYATGGILNGLKAGARAGQALAAMNSTTLTKKAGDISSTLLNAYALNQAEGVGIAVDVQERYKLQNSARLEKEYNAEKTALGLDLIIPNSEGFNEKQQQLEQLNTKYKDLQINIDEESLTAAEAALGYNRVNWLLNITSARRFLRTSAFTREAKKKVGFLKPLAGETLQEGLEENINTQAETYGMLRGSGEHSKNFAISEALASGTSAEAIESSLWGMVGGAGQFSMTNAINKTKYSPSRVYDKDTASYISKNEAVNKGYNEQQEYLKTLTGEAVKAKVIKTAALHIELDNTPTPERKKEIEKELFQNMAFEAMENGVADKMEELLTKLAKEEEDADPENTETKEILEESLKDLRFYEETFVKAEPYVNGNQVFDALVDQKRAEDNKAAVTEQLRTQSSELQKEATEEAKKYEVVTTDDKSGQITKVPLYFNVSNIQESNGQKRYKEFLESLKFTSAYKALYGDSEDANFSGLIQEEKDRQAEIMTAKEEVTQLTSFNTQKQMQTLAKQQTAEAEISDKLPSFSIAKLNRLKADPRYKGLKAKIEEEIAQKEAKGPEKAVKVEKKESVKPKGPVVNAPGSGFEFLSPEEQAEQRQQSAPEEPVSSTIIDDEDAINAQFGDFVSNASEEESAESTVSESSEATIVPAQVEKIVVNPARSNEAGVTKEIINGEDTKSREQDPEAEFEHETLSDENATIVKTLRTKAKNVANKIAYLAKNYKIVDGKKVDTENELNSEFFAPLLNAAKYKKGTDVKLVVNRDAEITVKGKKGSWTELLESGHVETSQENELVAIEVQNSDGEVLGYIHEKAWMSRENLGVDQETSEATKAKVQNIRNVIIEKGFVDTKIKSRSWGTLNKTVKGTKRKASEAMPDPTQIVTIYDSGAGGLIIPPSAKVKVMNTTPLEEGFSYALTPVDVPFKGVTPVIAIPLDTKKIGDKKAQSIVEAFKIFAFAEADSEQGEDYRKRAMEVHKITGFNILTEEGLSDYLSTLVYLKSNGNFNSSVQNTSLGESHGSIVQATLYKTKGTGKTSLKIGLVGQSLAKGKKTVVKGGNTYLEVSKENLTGANSEEALANLQHMADALVEAYFHTSKNHVNKKSFKAANITSQGLVTQTFSGTYGEYVKQNHETNVQGPQVDTDEKGNPVYSYRVQPIIRFDDSFAGEVKVEEKIETSSISARAVIEQERKEEIEKEDALALRRNPKGNGITYNTLNSINADYDSKLAALKSKPAQQTSEVDTDKAAKIKKANADYGMLPGIDDNISIPESFESSEVSEGVEPKSGPIKTSLIDVVKKYVLPKLGLVGTSDFVNTLSIRVIAQAQDGKKVSLKEVSDKFFDEYLQRGLKARAQAIEEQDEELAKMYNTYAAYFEVITEGREVLEKLASNYLQNLNIFKTSKITTEEESEIVLNEDGNDFARNDFSDDFSLTLDSKKTVSAQLKRALAFLEDKMTVRNPQTGEYSYATKEGMLGTTKYVPFDVAYNTLHMLLAETQPSAKAIIETLENYLAEANAIVPGDAPFDTNLGWIYSLVEKLKDKKTSHQLRAQLATDMAKSKVNMKNVYWHRGYDSESRAFVYKVKVGNDDSASTKMILLEQWNNTHAHLFASKEVGEDGIEYFTINAEKVASYKALIENIKKEAKSTEGGITEVHIAETFQAVGIFASKHLVRHIYEGRYTAPGRNKVKLGKAEMFQGAGLFANILKELEGKIGSKVDRDIVFTTGATKNLASFEARRRNKVFDNTFRVAGKSVSAYSNPMHLSREVSRLNTPEGITAARKSYMEGYASWLDYMDEKSTGAEKQSLNLMTYSLDVLKKSFTDGGKTARNTKLSSKSEGELEAVNLGFFAASQDLVEFGQNEQGIAIKRRRITLPFHTTSDKSVLRGVEFMAEDLNLNEEGSYNAILEKLYRTAVLGELDAKSAHIANLESVSEVGDIFFLMPELNVKEFKNGQTIAEVLLEAGNEAGVEENKELKAAVIQVLNAFIKKEAAAKLEFWKKNNIGVTSESVGSKKGQINSFIPDTYFAYAEARKKPEQTIAEFTALDMTLNHVLANANMQSLVVGDPALFAKPIYHRDAKGEKGEINIQATVIATLDNLGKRLAGEVGPGNELMDADISSYYQLYAKEPIVNSAEISNYRKLIGNDASEYDGIDIADASEWTTWREHLYNLNNSGKLTAEQYETAYKAFESGNMTEDFEIQKIILGALKPLTYGKVAIDVNGKTYNKKVYIKSASIPLLPGLTAGKSLDNLRLLLEHAEAKLNGNKGLTFNSKGEPSLENKSTKEDLQTENYVPVRMAIPSAVKVGIPLKDNLFSVFKEGTSEINSVQELIQEFDNAQKEKTEQGGEMVHQGFYDKISRRSYRLQQDNPYKDSKFNINRGTQSSKLIFNNILNEIISGKTTGRDLKEQYDQIYGEIFKSSLEELQAQFIEIDGSLNIPKVQKLLMEEAETRGYSIAEKTGLELNEEGTDFKYPIWAGASATRYMSLLNSLVNNRVIKRKLRGASSVLVADVGQNLSQDTFLAKEIQKKKATIHVGDYKGGELLPQRVVDGKVLPAQVITGFKFPGLNGENLDVRDFATYNEEGRLILDTAKIDPELLKSMAFRIPTQGLKSMSSVEIVGFLPKEYGDIVIAPKEFIVQMGSDFDVDKLYQYYYNSTIDETGKLVKLTEELSDQTADSENKINENKLLDIKLQILNSNNKNVRAEIVSPLSFGTLKFKGKSNPKFKHSNSALSDEINGKNGVAQAIWDKVEQTKSEMPNMLSSEYQRFKYANANAGKAGVGIFSLDSTLHTMLQGGTDIAFTGKPDEDFSVGFGTLISKGELGRVKTLSGKSRISTVIESFQSSALDNEKEQILTKLNINSETFDVIKSMSLLGYDEELISVFINQPIVLEYVAEAQKATSPLSEYDAEALDKVKKNLYSKYTEFGGDSIKTEVANRAANFEDQKDGGFSTMYNMIGKSLESLSVDETIEHRKTQAGILTKFLKLQTLGKRVGNVQQSLNLDSGGVGKNLFESTAREDKFLELTTEDLGIANIETTVVREGKDGELEYYGLPGLSYEYGVKANNAMWKPLFSGILNNEFEEMVSSIVEDSKNDYDTPTKLAELKEDVFSGVLAYAFSNVAREGLSLEETRSYLYKRGPGTFQDKVQNLLATDYAKKNSFLSGLTASFDSLGVFHLKYPNTTGEGAFADQPYIEFINMLSSDTATKNVDLDAAGYNSSQELAIDLLLYGLRKGGQTTGVSFVKFFPPEVLSTIYGKFFKTVKFTENLQASFTEQYMQHNPSLAHIVDSEDLTWITADKTYKIKDTEAYNRIALGEGEEKYLPQYITHRNEDKKTTNKNTLYILAGDRYVEIDTKGIKYGTDYAFGETSSRNVMNTKFNSMGTSNTSINGALVIRKANIGHEIKRSLGLVNKPKTSKYPALNNGTPEMMRLALLKVSLKAGDEYTRKMGSFLHDYMKTSNTTLEINESKNEKKGNIGHTLGNTVTIDLKKSSTLSDFTETLFHESLHIVLNKTLRAESRLSKEASKAKAELNRAYSLMKDKMLSDPKLSRNYLATMRYYIDSTLVPRMESFTVGTPEYKIQAAKITRIEKGIEGIESSEGGKISRSAYSLLNLEEFVIVAMTNYEMQNLLNGIKDTGKTESLFAKIGKLVAKLLKSLGIDLDSESVLNTVLSSGWELMNELNSEADVTTVSDAKTATGKEGLVSPEQALDPASVFGDFVDGKLISDNIAIPKINIEQLIAFGEITYTDEETKEPCN